MKRLFLFIIPILLMGCSSNIIDVDTNDYVTDRMPLNMVIPMNYTVNEVLMPEFGLQVNFLMFLAEYVEDNEMGISRELATALKSDPWSTVKEISKDYRVSRVKSDGKKNYYVIRELNTDHYPEFHEYLNDTYGDMMLCIRTLPSGVKQSYIYSQDDDYLPEFITSYTNSMGVYYSKLKE